MKSREIIVLKVCGKMPVHTRDLFIKRGACGGLASTTVLVLFSTFVFEGQSCQHQAVVALVGEAVVLPCHLEPAADAFDLVVEWTRPDLDSDLVHVWRDGKELVDFQGRTSLFRLKLGDASLQISGVKLSDAGTYRCLVPAHQDSRVELIVGSVSDPSVAVVSDHDAELVLECRSGGWFPEPELLWLDAEGKLLSAGPTETVRGSDDLYTVSSRVTVDKRHSSRYTCRVQQTSINHYRDTNILVADVSPSCFTLNSCVMLLVVLSVSVIVIWYLVWKQQ
ncbi:butyrophilin subfamily 3 member A2-like isoform X2 [Betta splendens]|uniref:Butyrophilin subfamily 3 member A2-like isoform X2 n=1 Tax=Betta splendens TaxID=158456 RepID=A0A9W2Y7G3_BETSP|nr:butyrophilin subfamily 3 member A2-like isoform X2 [Betta splendens]